MLPSRVVFQFLLLLFALSYNEGFLKSDVRQYILTQFEKDENARLTDARARGTIQLDLRFVSSTPFITANAFRDLCYPHVVDYNYTLPPPLQCNISTAMLKAVPDGACVYIASACFEKVVRFHLSYIPKSFSLVVHDGDQSIPGCTPTNCCITAWHIFFEVLINVFMTFFLSRVMNFQMGKLIIRVAGCDNSKPFLTLLGSTHRVSLLHFTHRTSGGRSGGLVDQHGCTVCPLGCLCASTL